MNCLFPYGYRPTFNTKPFSILIKYLVMKSKDYKLVGFRISIIFLILLVALVPNRFENSIGQGQADQKTMITDVDFGVPHNNTINLGTPFLVQYDNTTNVKAMGKATLDNFIVTFAGHGIINGSIKYNDNGTGVFITNPEDGTVYQRGMIELRTENGNDSIKTTYESLGIPIRQQYSDRHLLLDSGAMFFNVSSTIGGDLSFLNNRVGVYKDMLDRDRLNLTTIAWIWN
jgi:hypothetical protein